MIHEHFAGTHYEAGFRYGASLAARGRSILEDVPFPLTPERYDFARACVPVYETFFPEILEEIRGVAEGQHCEPEAIEAVLLGMYAIPPSCGCSCFAAANEHHILLGRNSDFIPALEEFNTNVIYRLTDGAYHFTGNTTAYIEIEDGVNERGLAAGLTSVWPTMHKPGLNAGLLLRYFMEKCGTVEDVLVCVQKLPIAGAQTIIAADAKGDIVLLECHPERTAVVRPARGENFVCATNAFHAPEMRPYRAAGVNDWRSEERYATLTNALRARGCDLDVPAAQALLAGKNGFLCQYDRAAGTDTVWSVVYDLTEKSIWRVEGNPSRRNFEKDERFLIG